MKRALITGVSGQDGAYLARLLLEKGYDVTGTVQASAPDSPWRLKVLGIDEKVRLIPFDLESPDAAASLLAAARPDEVYNLAALSSAARSFERPVQAFESTGLGALRLFEAARKAFPAARIFQASSAEMFGAAEVSPQNESTPLRPVSPYAVAKAAAHQGAAVYRKAYGLFVCSGILYNHESDLRGPEFVTSKIVREAVRLAAGGGEPLSLGNLDAKRDWGWAPDYVDAMWRMLQRPEAGDYVLATGRARSVREFASAAFEAAGLSLEWRGTGAGETGVARKDGRLLVRVDPAAYRPADPGELAGDASKAARELGWTSTVPFEELVARLVRSARETAPGREAAKARAAS